MTAEQTGTDQFFALADLSGPMALRVAATLKIADHIARGITSIPALAEATRADSAALSALLRYLTARGVFRCDADGEVGLGTLGAFQPALLGRDALHLPQRQLLRAAAHDGRGRVRALRRDPRLAGS